MNRDELIRRLSETFIEELAEHVRVLNAELLALERESSSARREQSVHALFRAAHSLKGAARAVDQNGIERVAHQTEELLSRVRAGRRALTRELFQVLFATADAIQSAGQRFAEGSSSDAELAPLLEQLEVVLREPDSPPNVEERALTSAQALPDTARTPEPTHPEDEATSLAEHDVTEPRAGVSVAQHSFARISHERLELLLRQKTELHITRRRFAGRRDELGASQEQVARLRTEWKNERLALLRREHHDAARAPLNAELPRRIERLLSRSERELLGIAREVERLSQALAEDVKALDRAAKPLEEQIQQLGLLPFAAACEGLSRVVRDLAVLQHKQVELVISGADLQVDRAVVERLREPLLHLVRNGVDHGIESPEQRVLAGKPERATLTVAAVAEGDAVEVSVSDDGRGLDESAIRGALEERGLTAKSSVEWQEAIFAPGFSTATRVSDVSGRGVGLDVVKIAVERMNGSVSVRSEQTGTRFVLRLPLTLSTLRVLFVRAGGEVVALPASAVDVLLRVNESELKWMADKAVISHRGAALPLAALSALLGFEARGREPGAPLLGVVLAAEGRRVALIVDELLSTGDVILKSLGPRVQDLELVASGTLLETGEVALVLKPQALLASALGVGAASVAAIPAPLLRQARRRLLLADDSLTMRALERSILEAAGYDVLVAVDGASAWQMLEQQGADLLLSDVEMPNLDGLSLTEAVRSSARFRDLPVILLTSRDTPEDRARGLKVGANAYLVKNAFDQEKLLQTIEQLL